MIRYFAAGTIAALIVFLTVSIYEALTYVDSPKAMSDRDRMCNEAMVNAIREMNDNPQIAQNWATHYKELGCYDR